MSLLGENTQGIKYDLFPEILKEEAVARLNELGKVLTKARQTIYIITSGSQISCEECFFSCVLPEFCSSLEYIQYNMHHWKVSNFENPLVRFTAAISYPTFHQ